MLITILTNSGTRGTPDTARTSNAAYLAASFHETRGLRGFMKSPDQATDCFFQKSA